MSLINSEILAFQLPNYQFSDYQFFLILSTSAVLPRRPALGALSAQR